MEVRQQTTEAAIKPSSARHKAGSARALAAVVFVGAAAVLAMSTVQSSSARFTASTDTNGNVSSAVLALELDEPGGAMAEIPLTETQVLSNGPIMTCADVVFDGSTEATARFFAAVVQSSGLERYATIQVLARRGPCGTGPVRGSEMRSVHLNVDDPGVWVVYEGPLLAVVGARGGRPLPAGAGGGVDLLDDLQPGEQLAVGFTITLASSEANVMGSSVDLNFLVEVVA